MLLAPCYTDSAYLLGKCMAQRGHRLVYGAGANGVMGAVARGVFENGGEVIGVAPKFFNVDGVLFPHCAELIRPETMRERKAIMEDRSQAFVIAPGGVGTFDEFFEMLTLKQLGRHKKCMVVYNAHNYYDPLLEMLKHSVQQRFVGEGIFDLFSVCNEENAVLDAIEQYKEQEADLKGLKNI